MSFASRNPAGPATHPGEWRMNDDELGRGQVSFELYTGDGKDWNEFALSHPGVRFCHLWQYGKVVEDSYGYRPQGFVARRGGAIVAVMPSQLARSLLFGRRLVSQPFSEYGGFLGRELSDDAVEAFFGYARQVCTERRIRQLELHGRPEIPEELRTKLFGAANRYDHAVLELDPDPDTMWSERFEYQVRKALKKAARSNVKSFRDNGETMIRENFWPLFLRSMKRLGSPPHPLGYFIGLRREFPNQLQIFWAEVDGRVVAGLLGFAVGQSVQITNIVSDESFWDLRVNDLIHWEFIQWACRNGYREFDFGSVRYEGQRRYKKKWGAEIRPSGYYCLRGLPAGDGTFSSSSKLMTTFSQMWRRFVPTAVTAWAGPVIRKQLVR
jgi:hypothetical protein